MKRDEPRAGADRWRAAASVPSAPDWGRRGLSRASWQIARAACQTFLTDRDERGRLVAPSDAECRAIVDAYDLGVGGASRTLRAPLQVMFQALEWLPAAVLRRPGRFSRMPLGERIAYLEALENSRTGMLSMLLLAIKVPMLIHAFEHGEALRQTGFDRPSIASRRRWSDPAATESAVPPRAAPRQETSS